MPMIHLLCLLVLLCSCSVKIECSLSDSDKITQLPGQPQVGFQQFSGYVNVDNHKKERALFYYFVEADIDPASKPLVLWLNGGVKFNHLYCKFSIIIVYIYSHFDFVGPGCSSLGVGAFSENGPFRPNGDILVKNDYSWNSGTNVQSLV